MTQNWKELVSVSAEAAIERVKLLKETESQHQSFWNDNPFPAWLKWVRDGKVVMGKVNQAYTAATGITVRAYEGEEDSAIWGEGIGFNKADREVICTRARVQIAEQGRNPLSHIDEVWCGWKWPEMRNGEVVGIWGKAVPIPKPVYDEFEELVHFIIFKTLI